MFFRQNEHYYFFKNKDIFLSDAITRGRCCAILIYSFNSVNIEIYEINVNNNNNNNIESESESNIHLNVGRNNKSNCDSKTKT